MLGVVELVYLNVFSFDLGVLVVIDRLDLRIKLVESSLTRDERKGERRLEVRVVSFG